MLLTRIQSFTVYVRIAVKYIYNVTLAYIAG